MVQHLLNTRIAFFPGLLVALATSILCSDVQAFLQWQDETLQGDARLFGRIYGIAYQNPDNEIYFDERDGAGIAGVVRLLAQSRYREHWSVETNIYQTWIPDRLSGVSGSAIDGLDVERSSALERSFSDEDYVRLAADRLNLRAQFSPLDITLGRQPVNLATTYYFSPNDFFAPFAAQTFYRVYKPGVDALRIDYQAGELSQVNLIGVLGYRPDADSDTGWSRESDGRRNSVLLRGSLVLADWDLALLGGKVRRSRVMGAAVQGELWEWLGIRGEGHYADPEEAGPDPHQEWSVGFEHRWESSLNINAEWFYHGDGADDRADYMTAATSTGETGYLARQYAAMGMSYEFTPLLTGQGVLLRNLVDGSGLVSLNAVYSLADEAELSAGVSIPFGAESEGVRIRSEFGLAPRTLSLEVRAYY